MGKEREDMPGSANNDDAQLKQRFGFEGGILSTRSGYVCLILLIRKGTPNAIEDLII